MGDNSRKGKREIRELKEFKDKTTKKNSYLLFVAILVLVLGLVFLKLHNP